MPANTTSAPEAAGTANEGLKQAEILDVSFTTKKARTLQGEAAAASQLAIFIALCEAVHLLILEGGVSERVARNELQVQAVELGLVDYYGLDKMLHLIDRHVAGQFKAEISPKKLPPQDRRRLLSRRASEIPFEAIDWIWPARIAAGKHTSIAGDPGAGKSTLSLFIAATVSVGGEWPCLEGKSPVGDVIILSAEDGAADTIVPRLEAAGANLDRIHIVNGVRKGEGNGRSGFSLQNDLDLLEQRIDEIKSSGGHVALVLIDPVSSYLGKTDSHKNSEVRGVLEPLSEMAERKRVAVVSITHFNKLSAGQSKKALSRFIGSIAFVGAPRVAFAVVEDPADRSRRLFLHAKNNLSAPPQGLAYSLHESLVRRAEVEVVASRVQFEIEPVLMTADEVLANEAGSGEHQSVLVGAECFLRDLLAGGPVPEKQVRAAADNVGLSWATVRRAGKRLGVVHTRESHGADGAGRWLWSLPTNVLIEE